MDHTDDCGFTAEIRFLGLGKLWNMYVDLFSKLNNAAQGYLEDSSGHLAVWGSRWARCGSLVWLRTCAQFSDQELVALRLSHQDTWNMALCTKCPSKTRPRSKIFGSFLPSLHRHITNKMWFKKSSSVSTNHNWYLLVMCHIPFQILSTWSNEFETNFQKEALLALDILISYILRKILGGIGYKYDAISLQRLWCMLCDQKLWLCSSTTKP